MKYITALFLSIACTAASAKDVCFSALHIDRSNPVYPIYRDVYVKFKTPKLKLKTAATATGYIDTVRSDNKNARAHGFAYMSVLMRPDGKISYSFYVAPMWGDVFNADNLHYSTAHADTDYQKGDIEKGSGFQWIPCASMSD
jgi:hypothetical protein